MVTLEKRYLYGGNPALVLKWLSLAMLICVFEMRIMRTSWNQRSSRSKKPSVQLNMEVMVASVSTIYTFESIQLMPSHSDTHKARRSHME